MALSSSGPGHRPLTAKTGVRVPVGSPMKNIYKLVIFIVTIILIFIFAYQIQTGEETFIQTFINNYGYIAVITLSFLSGFVLTFSVPAGLWANYYLDAGLSYPLILLLITIGVTLGDTVSVLFASFLKEITENRNIKIINILKRWREKSHNIPLILLFFHASFAPISNEILLYPLVFFGYRLWVLLLITFAGNFIFTFSVAQFALWFF